MTDEDKRSCFNCRHHTLCFLRHRVYMALAPGNEGARMFENAPRRWTDIFDTLAEACNQFQRIEQEAET